MTRKTLREALEQAYETELRKAVEKAQAKLDNWLMWRDRERERREAEST